MFGTESQVSGMAITTHSVVGCAHMTRLNALTPKTDVDKFVSQCQTFPMVERSYYKLQATVGHTYQNGLEDD